MKRYRFEAPFEKNNRDYRPVKWPVKYPYWCSGETYDAFIMIAYEDNQKRLKELWPEARNIESEDCDEIVFTSRFRCPEWWENTENIKTREL